MHTAVLLSFSLSLGLFTAPGPALPSSPSQKASLKAKPSPARVVMEGRVKEVRGIPKSLPVLKTESQSSFVLVSRDPAYQAELRHLFGQSVRVWGELRPETDPVELEVFQYELIRPLGQVAPRIGLLAELKSAKTSTMLFIDASGQAMVLPEGWRRALASHFGAKIWLDGRLDADGSFQPMTFGLLRPQPNPSPSGKE